MSITRSSAAIRAAFLAAVAFGGMARAAEDTIFWLVSPVAPTYVEDGKWAGQGSGDAQLRYFFAHLPQYRHERLFASFHRIWRDMAVRDAVCTHSVFRSPDRERVALFSDRPMKGTGYRLFADSALADRYKPFLDSEGDLDLDLLAGDGALRGGYIDGRLLPERVFDALRSPGFRPRITVAQSHRQILQSMAAGRTDFFFALPVEVSFFKDDPEVRQSFVSFPIKGVPKTINYYTACSKKPVGRAVIASINAMQRGREQWEDFVQPLRPWFPAEDFAENLASMPERGN